MDLITITAIALGLSVDSFAVSLSCGVIESKIHFRNAVRIAFILALFQGGLTVLGFSSGQRFQTTSRGMITGWLLFF